MIDQVLSRHMKLTLVQAVGFLVRWIWDLAGMSGVSKEA